MMPEMLHMLMREPPPLKTLDEMRQVTVPTMIIHGDRDEMAPIDQAIAAHRACGSGAKKLVRYARGHHNDLRIVVSREYYSELRLACNIAAGILPPEALLQADSPAGFIGMISGALRCFPGMRRCLEPSGAAQP